VELCALQDGHEVGNYEWGSMSIGHEDILKCAVLLSAENANSERNT